VTAMLPLGKTPARPGAVQLKLSSYLNTTALPAPPKDFGHDQLPSWGMLGNDQYGDCVFAGAAHETMLWNAAAGRAVPFDDTAVLGDYSAVTGFTPTDPNTDQGTDMQVAASYRRKTGVADTHGTRHQVSAYVALQVGNVKELLLAAYLFEAVGIGIRFPRSAMTQFNRGRPWSVVSGSPIEGGHYVPCVGSRKGQLLVVSWGRVQAMTTGFYRKYCDEAIVYLTAENLTGGKTVEGFDTAALTADLHAVSTVSGPLGARS